MTTFVVEISKSLDTDYAEVTANLLVETVALLRAGNNETARMSVPAAGATIGPSATEVWVIGLWMTSLVLSLSTGLFAVLAKQWLRHYATQIPGTARDRAFIRHHRWIGFNRWKVPNIVGLLLFFSKLQYCCSLRDWLFGYFLYTR